MCRSPVTRPADNNVLITCVLFDLVPLSSSTTLSNCLHHIVKRKIMRLDTLCYRRERAVFCSKLFVILFILQVAIKWKLHSPNSACTLMMPIPAERIKQTIVSLNFSTTCKQHDNFLQESVRPILFKNFVKAYSKCLCAYQISRLKRRFHARYVARCVALHGKCQRVPESSCVCKIIQWRVPRHSFALAACLSVN